jgi:hypothetical protein
MSSFSDTIKAQNERWEQEREEQLAAAQEPLAELNRRLREHDPATYTGAYLSYRGRIHGSHLWFVLEDPVQSDGKGGWVRASAGQPYVQGRGATAVEAVADAASGMRGGKVDSAGEPPTPDPQMPGERYIHQFEHIPASCRGAVDAYAAAWGAWAWAVKGAAGNEDELAAAVVLRLADLESALASVGYETVQVLDGFVSWRAIGDNGLEARLRAHLRDAKGWSPASGVGTAWLLERAAQVGAEANPDQHLPGGYFYRVDRASGTITVPAGDFAGTYLAREGYVQLTCE